MPRRNSASSLLSWAPLPPPRRRKRKSGSCFDCSVALASRQSSSLNTAIRSRVCQRRWKRRAWRRSSCTAACRPTNGCRPSTRSTNAAHSFSPPTPRPKASTSIADAASSSITSFRGARCECSRGLDAWTASDRRGPSTRSLVAGDTAERLVLAPLARRAAGARHSTAGASRFFNALTESRIASAVLAGEELPPIDNGNQCSEEPDDRLASIGETLTEMDRLVARRQWRAQSAWPEGSFDSKTSASWRHWKRPRNPGRRRNDRLRISTTRHRRRPDRTRRPRSRCGREGRSDEDVRLAVAAMTRSRFDEVIEMHKAMAAALRRRERDIAAADRARRASLSRPACSIAVPSGPPMRAGVPRRAAGRRRRTDSGV